jgi:thioredoxin 1
MHIRGANQVADENMNRTRNISRPLQLDGANFDSEVLRSKMPVLVAFSANWSRPCTILDPVLDEIASECSGKLKVARVNADGNLDLSLQYDVQAMPTLLYFVSGNVRAKIVGTATKQAILSELASTRKNEA